MFGRKHLITLGIGVLAGYVLANRLATLPVVNKIPQV